MQASRQYLFIYLHIPQHTLYKQHHCCEAGYRLLPLDTGRAGSLVESPVEHCHSNQSHSDHRSHQQYCADKYIFLWLKQKKRNMVIFFQLYITSCQTHGEGPPAILCCHWNKTKGNVITICFNYACETCGKGPPALQCWQVHLYMTETKEKEMW